MNPAHKFLTAEEKQISIARVKKMLVAELEALSIQTKSLDWNVETLEFQMTDGFKTAFKLTSLLAETRSEGFPRSLYQFIDKSDRFFSIFEVAATGRNIGWTMKFCDYEKTFRAPCRVAPVERELSEDILHFRELACETSEGPEFAACLRSYRSYLQSSISLIDAFLNRYVHVAQFEGSPTVPAILTSPAPIIERIEAWISTFGSVSFSDFRNATEWSQFEELRAERNRSVHAVEPYFGFYVKDMPRFLNYAQNGIGGLLRKMRLAAGERSLEFIERLRNAPNILYIPNT